MNIEDIIKKYNSGLSIRQIAESVGFSPSKIYNMLHSANTQMRSSREGLRLTKQNNSPLSSTIIHKIEGELLGDGCLQKRTWQSSFSFTNHNKDYTYWLANLFIENEICLSGKGIYKETYYHKNWGKWYTRYSFCTLCSIQFEELESQWYIARKKIVPKCLKISPDLVLHWFLGDGSLPKKEYAIFCTDSFSHEEVCFLSDSLNKTIGIKSSPTSYKNCYRLFVPKTSVPALLEYIGPTPFESLKHKWNLNSIGKINEYIDVPKETLKNYYINHELTQKELSVIFGCSKNTIQKKLYEYKIYKRASNKIFHIDKNKLMELYIEKDLTMAQTAGVLGCSAELVKKLLRTNGIRKKTWRKG